jgi:hypothetical protein
LGWKVVTYQKNILSQSSGYNIEDSSSSEMLVVIYQIAWHHIPADRNVAICHLTALCDKRPSYVLMLPTIFFSFSLPTDPFILPVAISGNHSMFNT